MGGAGEKKGDNHRGNRKKRKDSKIQLRVGSVNVRIMAGKGRKLADMMERRMIDMLYMQTWVGSKMRLI